VLNNSQEGKVGEKPPSCESYSSMIVVGERERERERERGDICNSCERLLHESTDGHGITF